MDNDAWSRFKAIKPNTKPISAPKSAKRRAPAVNPKKDPEDIFTLWEDQKKMQREDAKLARELKETKAKAKELSRTLRRNQYGDVKSELSDKTTKYASLTKKTSKKLLRSVKSKKVFEKMKIWSGNHKKISSGFVVMLVVLISFSVFSLRKIDTTKTLGDSTTNSSTSDTTQTESSGDKLPREAPSFSMLYPSGKSAEDYDVVRISPNGNAPSYTFIDHFDGVADTFQVTQQETPKDFNLDKVAESFQATNVIQIDENKIYHGYSEKTGTQSLLFLKNSKFVLIASPKKFSDEQWAGYVISLN